MSAGAGRSRWGYDYPRKSVANVQLDGIEIGVFPRAIRVLAAPTA